MTEKRSRRLAIAISAIVVVLCCGCATIAVASRLISPTSSTMPTGAVNLCVGAIYQPKFQVGVWWQAIFMSRLLPASISPYAVCTFVDWPSIFPITGEIALPP